MIKFSKPTPKPAQAVAVDAGWTVNELLQRRTDAGAILNAFGIDTCCGGNRSLREAASDDMADLAELLQALASPAIPEIA